MPDDQPPETPPLEAVGDGRTPGGRFAPGNRAGKGNPHARRVQKLRAAYVMAVKVSDMKAVVDAVLAAAKTGDIAAARELCDRILGKAAQSELLERIERLEQLQQENTR